MGRLVRTVEQIIARIAGRQHAIITWAELIAARISRKQILHRIDIGLLIRVYRGVYSVGHPPLTWQARYMAAVKACGEGAVLCGRAAAYLLGILKSPSPPPPEVMTPKERRVKGLKPRTVQLDRRDVTKVQGIASTTPARTIIDLAPAMEDDPFARLCHEAGVLHKTTPRQVKAAMKRKGRCRTKYGVTVELLSYRFHNSKHSWDQDHERKRQARARGDKWRSFTYDDVFKDQTYMLDELRDLLR